MYEGGGDKSTGKSVGRLTKERNQNPHMDLLPGLHDALCDSVVLQTVYNQKVVPM